MEKRKNTFMNNVAAILGSQFLIKLLGLAYIRGFFDRGNDAAPADTARATASP